jgi:hypothetical protein
MEYENINSIKIKGKKRRLSINKELGIIKRRRTFNGLFYLDKWVPILEKHLDLDKKLNCLEIGSHEGQSATFFLKKILNHSDSKLLCCDPWFKSHWLNLRPSGLSYEDIFDLNIKDNPKVKKYRGLNSNLYKEKWFEKQKYDIIYIDDIHTEKSMILNVKQCIPCLKKGGIIIFDDYDKNLALDYEYDRKTPKFWCDPVKKVVDALIDLGQMEILLKNYQVILRMP